MANSISGATNSAASANTMDTRRMMMERFNLSAAEYDYAKADFDDMDADGTGMLSFTEIQMYLADDGDMSNMEAAELMALYDLNGDGRISLEEFLQVFTGGNDTAAACLLPTRFIDSNLPSRQEWERSLALPLVERAALERTAAERRDAVEEEACASPSVSRKASEEVRRVHMAQIAMKGLVSSAARPPNALAPFRLKSKRGGGAVHQASELLADVDLAAA